MADNFKKAVLDRLKDAVVLYCKGVEKNESSFYLSSLYMSGYVIEIGIKIEIERLSSIEINASNLQGVINYLSNKNNILSPFSLGVFLEKIQGVELKNASTQRKIGVLFEKKSLKHDIKEFLERLKDWKSTFNENSFEIADYDFVQRYGWTTDLRYGDISNGLPAEDAKNALTMAIKFLKDIVIFEKEEDINLIKDYEKIFNDANGIILTIEDDIATRETTLTNED